MRMTHLFVFMTCLLGAPTLAQAQIHEGDLRFQFDTSLFSWVRQTAKGDDFERKYTSQSTGTNAGVFMGGGMGLGYAAARHAVVGLYMGLSHWNQETETKINGAESNGDSSILQLELRPNVEVPFLPGRGFVPFAQFGLAYRYAKTDNDGGEDPKDHGIGPTVGLGAHAFAAKPVSFDFSLTFRPLFIVGDSVDALEDNGVEDAKIREYSILFNLGASYWF